MMGELRRHQKGGLPSQGMSLYSEEQRVLNSAKRRQYSAARTLPLSTDRQVWSYIASKGRSPGYQDPNSFLQKDLFSLVLAWRIMVKMFLSYRNLLIAQHQATQF